MDIFNKNIREFDNVATLDTYKDTLEQYCVCVDESVCL